MVSTSRTPGHTKHFQTLYLTPKIRVCDCPGLVFPSLVDKQLQVSPTCTVQWMHCLEVWISETLYQVVYTCHTLYQVVYTHLHLTGVCVCVCQILTGIYPIAQVREPYTAVGYLAQRTALVEGLQLVPPQGPAPVFKKTPGRRVGDWEMEKGAECSSHVREEVEEEVEWTAWDICDGRNGQIIFTLCDVSPIILAWAIKKGYYTSRAGRPDTYRAGGCGFFGMSVGWHHGMGLSCLCIL